MYSFEIKPTLKKILKKLSKKDKSLYGQVLKKIEEIINCYNVEVYKNLRYGMRESKRIHVGHFVLIFDYDKKQKLISFKNFEHHDDVYF
ncbi:addiction module toxin RelE [archaeon]|jgi:mRNA-degrading endonuclease RelE of RelBE toxin-antitoxin system|nr:addiction module toxin RelE [archaeon]MBT4373725.1 addiction module toxin RelE [archaeon]MBT4531779.1 addiction module toxin RelE [archaeon]MBT7001891.1 addiction module toxin RelE [archaeon]MBT7281876.1 addiction module toxin RelE [archaeon]